MTNLIGILNLKAKWKKRKGLETKMIIYVNLKDVTLDVRLKFFYPTNKSYHFWYSYFYFYSRLILVLLRVYLRFVYFVEIKNDQKRKVQ